MHVKPIRRRARRRTVAGLAALALSAVAAPALLSPGTGLASSHREAPLTSADPQIDTTDFYMFNSPQNDGTVTLIGDWIPFEDPSGGPNFYKFSHDARYQFLIDNNGDGAADLAFQYTFTDHYRNPGTFLYNTGPVTSLTSPNLNFYQTYNLTLWKYGKKTTSTKLISNAPVAPSNVGAASMPNYAALRSQAVQGAASNVQTFAGQADDPFFLDLRVFDLLYGGNLSEVGHDSLSGYNVNSIALKVPKALLAAGSKVSRNPVVGAWTQTTRQSTRVQTAKGSQSYQGSWVSVSRLGSPLVNEVVVPVGLKDHWNASYPKNDAQFAGAVLDPEVPKLIQSIYGIPAPKTPRNDLVAAFLTGVTGLNASSMDADHGKLTPSEMLRLNMAIAPSAKPNRLGVVGGDNAGFPNGRRLTDDVVDIELQALEGVLLPGHPAAVDTLGDGVNANDVAFGSSFPYLALPHQG